jgi:ketosteroid isomerase-like protein
MDGEERPPLVGARFERASRQRSSWEGIGLRFARRSPRLARALAAFAGRAWSVLPANSTIRRKLLEQAIRRSYAAFNRQDVEALRTIHHRDCVFDMSHVPDWPEDATYYGHDGLMTYLRDWHAQWQDVHYEPIEVTEPIKGTILIESEVRAVGRGSGVPVEATFFQVGLPRAGLVWAVHNFRDRDEAVRYATAEASDEERRKGNQSRGSATR